MTTSLFLYDKHFNGHTFKLYFMLFFKSYLLIIMLNIVLAYRLSSYASKNALKYGSFGIGRSLSMAVESKTDSSATKGRKKSSTLTKALQKSLKKGSSTSKSTTFESPALKFTDLGLTPTMAQALAAQSKVYLI